MYETLGKLPPSSKLVNNVLASGDELTQRQIANWTLLPPRTVRYGITKLQQNSYNGDIIESRPSHTDAREILYTTNFDQEAYTIIKSLDYHLNGEDIAATEPFNNERQRDGKE